jgi:uroporphyrinogen decarboxylase
MIEGRTRGDISIAKALLAAEPALVSELLEKIAHATAAYLKSQIEAGASVIQLFDTWAGELTADEYSAHELPVTKMVYDLVGHENIPKILYAKGSKHLIPHLGKSGANVISVDWRTDLAETRRQLGPSVTLQGNVDPELLKSGTESQVREAAQTAVAATEGFGHILNLGHGILPTTPVRNAQAFVEAGKAAKVSATRNEKH